MTAAEFRRLALAQPEAVEASHMDHPDFRVGNKIFATLDYPEKGWAMVKVTSNQQKLLVREDPEGFRPVKGVWGERGATNVILRSASRPLVRKALAAAWANTAPKALVRAQSKR